MKPIKTQKEKKKKKNNKTHLGWAFLTLVLWCIYTKGHWRLYEMIFDDNDVQ